MQIENLRTLKITPPLILFRIHSVSGRVRNKEIIKNKLNNCAYRHIEHQYYLRLVTQYTNEIIYTFHFSIHCTAGKYYDYIFLSNLRIYYTIMICMSELHRNL